MAEKRPTPVKPLTIYFYHTRLTRESYEEWKDYKFPGHILYGLPLLEKYGIRSVMHKYKAFPSRLKLMLYATKEILCCKEPYEVLYGTSFRGLELIILLRALGLYRKPIVIWHHTALKTSSRKIRERRMYHTTISSPPPSPSGDGPAGKESSTNGTSIIPFWRIHSICSNWNSS